MGEEVKYLGPEGLDTLISSIVEAYAKKVDVVNPTSQVIESTTHSTPVFLKSNLTQESWLGFKNVNGTNIGYYGVVDHKPVYYYGGNKEIALVDDMLPSLTSNSTILSNSANGVIKGINVAGKSEQITTQTLATVQGSMPSTAVGDKINAAVASTHELRCCSNIVYLSANALINITSGYEIFTMYSTSADGNIIANSGGWEASKVVDKDGYYRFQIRKSDNSTINPTMFTLTASNVKPTPTNPIPIVDASGEVSAHTKNLVPYTVTSGIKEGVSYTIDGDGTVTLNGKANNSSTIDFYRDIHFIPSEWEKGNKYVFGAKFTNNTTVGIAHFGTYPYINGAWDTNNCVVLEDTGEVEWTVPTNAVGILCRIGTQGGKTYNNLIIKPYVYESSNTITLPFSPKSVGSAANELIVNEDGSGKIIQRVYEAVFDGSDDEEWGMDYGSGMFATPSSGDNVQPIGASSANPISTNFVFNGVQSGMYANLKDGEFGIQFLMHCARIFCKYLAKTSVAEWKAWLSQNPITVYYQLATPIETELTPEQVASILALQTYKGTTTIESEMDVVSVSYYKNTDIGSAIGEVSTRAVENSVDLISTKLSLSNAIAEVNDRVDGLEQLINNLDILDEEEF